MKIRRAIVILFSLFILAINLVTAELVNANFNYHINITIQYNQNSSDYINISYEGGKKSYSISSQSDSIAVTNSRYVEVSTSEGNITKYCSELSRQYSQTFGLLNDSIRYAGLYAECQPKVTQLEENIKNVNERRKECELQLPQLKTDSGQLPDMKKNYVECSDTLSNTKINLQNTTQLYNLEKNNKPQNMFIGGIIGAGLVMIGIYLRNNQKLKLPKMGGSISSDKELSNQFK